LTQVRDAVGDATMLVGSGLDPGNAALLLGLADGAIVGTFFKRDGRVDQPVDLERVRSLRLHCPR
jgi:predicted TIM-barrel enzyme